MSKVYEGGKLREGECRHLRHGDCRGMSLIRSERIRRSGFSLPGASLMQLQPLLYWCFPLEGRGHLDPARALRQCIFGCASSVEILRSHHRYKK
jgi:hypothetical protein